MRQHYHTYQAYLAMPLYKIARGVAMKRANGICEECNAAPATEVHHIQYPVWGTFDTPSNLRPICHDCHCREHEVEHYAKPARL